ncbi:MAG: substrate-binding domain-containing protein [Lactobacillus sp.]|jgi:LacI family transcriptional regulator|nr:substrate-binding domain-containing protein [Lactobacillus sp.]MCH3905987.1 substrate-binding domain-containing protein [Lactobacillus sp.]MCH3990439.1 substrate-binding domain-containing protein [Lactobacillus sp.]MCH4068846.1 substrate-binding domain-containing protein [Lactobacillus sp.]MCI1304471.1 substrate-binding domain-containing protein [Lactobacillus sp.]
MHKQDVTIYDVAREAKVSMATVSRVVNGNNNVRKSTRDRVQSVIKRLHYQPNSVAQGLASKRTTTVGLIIPDMTNMFFAELAQGINDIATIYRYSIILSSVSNELMKEEDTVQSLLNKQVDGMIYMSDRLSPAVHEVFDRTSTPVVLASTLDADGDLPSVAIDYRKAMKQALDLLYQDGKRDLAFVISDYNATINVARRIPVFENFIKEHHLGVPRIYRDVLTYDQGEKVFAQLQQEHVDGVIVSSDLAAAGIINAAKAAGVKIPEDFEVIAAGSTKISELVRPKLTCVRSPLYDIGAVAMRMLTKLMGDEDLTHRKVKLPFNLVKQETTLNQ